MQDLVIVANQTAKVATFENYEEVKQSLQEYIHDTFADMDYSVEGLGAANADFKELKSMHDKVAKKQKELKNAYSAPYATVEGMLKDLLDIIDPAYKKAKDFIDEAEKEAKKAQILQYAEKQAEGLGEIGARIVNSPAFFRKDWLLKKYTVKKYQDEVTGILSQAASDLNSIQAAGGDHTAVLTATYIETLSMEKVKSFQATYIEDMKKFRSNGEY